MYDVLLDISDFLCLGTIGPLNTDIITQHDD